jgi:uncharacterized protein
MFGTIKRRLVRTLAATSVVFAIVSTAARPAEAMTPTQTQATKVVGLLSANTTIGGIQDFWAYAFRSWGYTYVKPAVYIYGQGVWDGYVCGGAVDTRTMRQNAFFCRTGEFAIYVDINWFQSVVNTYGDFAAGGLLAHEWGHAMAYLLGYTVRDYREEYHADCFAGMYARYGYQKGLLNGSDYSELRNWYVAQPFYADHGYGSTRAQWYDYGYTQYSLYSCNLAYNMTGP